MDKPADHHLPTPRGAPNDADRGGGRERPPVEAFDPYFRKMFDRSESFFRRCDRPPAPRDGVKAGG